MISISKKPLSIGLYGLPKEGKSHFAASFVKEFGGLVLEPVAIQQLPPKKGEPSRFVIDPNPVGHAIYAIENVGLDIDTQYKYVRTWDEYDQALEDLLIKGREDGKKPWLVIDDTNQWRTLRAYHLSLLAKRGQITLEDYKQTGGDLVTEMNKLKGAFNCIYVNQMKEKYIGKDPSGIMEPATYPANATSTVEIFGRFWKDRQGKTRNFDIDFISTIDDLPDSFTRTIIGVTPKKLLEVCGIPVEIW